MKINSSAEVIYRKYEKNVASAAVHQQCVITCIHLIVPRLQSKVQ